MACVQVLGNIADPEAVSPLIALLNDKDLDVLICSVEALKNITGQNFGRDTEQWTEWWNKNRDQYLMGKSLFLSR